MKCPYCEGTGITKMPTFDDEMPILEETCIRCNGTGKIEATNEEWLKSLDTEGLVDYLYEVFKGGNTVERQFWIEKHKERFKMQFRGWLKEKHNE